MLWAELCGAVLYLVTFVDNSIHRKNVVSLSLCRDGFPLFISFLNLVVFNSPLEPPPPPPPPTHTHTHTGKMYDKQHHSYFVLIFLSGYEHVVPQNS